MAFYCISYSSVKPGPNQLAWDLGFIAFGGLLAVIGWIMIKKDSIVINE
ncbi:MAG: DUF2243 domain-containing protein [Nostoc sp. CreGUA01]